jgi:photosystem II stability/assembly factor-like uncharacterized protein
LSYSVTVAPSDEEVLYSDLGMHSLDGGETWARDGSAASVLAVHPELPRTALGFGPGAIWRTPNASATWRRLGTVDECVVINRMVIDPQTPTNVYALGSFSIGCAPLPVCASLRSTDGGRSWSCMGDLPEHVHSFVIAPSQPSTLYAYAGYGYPFPKLFKTLDGGQSWQPHGADLGGASLTGLAVSPEDPDLLYAVRDRVSVRSTDGAATWVPVSGLPAGQDFVIVFAPSDAAVRYAVTSGTAAGLLIYQSTDAGASWALLSNEGLPTGTIFSLQVSPTDPRTLFAGVNGGMYRVRGAGE